MYRSYKSSDNTAAMAGTASSLKTILFLGSTREGRFGLRVAKFVKKQLEANGHSVDLFDPAEMPFPLLTKAVHWSDPSTLPKWLQDAAQKVKDADAYVVVSAEYNHSIPPALSNMMDHFPCSSFAYKPSGIVCYSMGPFGGVRAAMQLRALLGELGCLSVSNIFAIPVVQNAFDEEGTPLDEHMVPGSQRLIAQLNWHASAMKTHRDKFGVPK